MLNNADTKSDFASVISGKRVLFVATKNEDYIRIRQEEKIIREYASDSKIFVSDAKNYFVRCLKVLGSLMLTDCSKFDIVVVGFMAQMIVPFFKWKFRKSFLVVDFFISMFDTLVDDRKKIRDGSLGAKLFHMIDNNTLKAADYIISDTKTHGDFFAEEFGINRGKIHTLYLEADTSSFFPQTVEKPDNLKDKYVVLYFGSILPLQGVDVVINTVSLAKTQSPNVYFVIIGPMKNKYEVHNDANVTYIDWLDHENLAKYIAFSDLCLAGHFSKEINKAKRTIPGKAYIYSAMNKRIIFGDTPANRELFTDDDNSIFVETGSSEKLLAAIINEAEKWGKLDG